MKKNFLVLLLTLFMLTAISAPAAAAGQEQGFNFAGLPGISTEKVSLPATTVFSTNTTVLSTTGNDDTISKAEWIHQLVTTFDMTVEQNNYPDNYYSDLTTDHQYYKDIMIAVQFGVIDLPAGEALAPDAPANREFVAHTLNFCLGYQPEENTEYTFSEASTVTYPDDIQIAINKGWFTLTDGAFLPESPVTSIQAAELLKIAKEINVSAEVDTSHKDTITFKDNVVVVPKGTEVTVDEDGTTVRITNCPVNIAVGDTFAVYTDIVPGTYSAEKVTKNGSDLVISVKEVPFEDAVTAFDIEGSSTADLTDTVPVDDAEIYYVLKNGTQTQSRAKAIDYGVDYIKITKTIKVSNGVSVKITGSLTNLYTDYKASFTEVKVITSGVATVNCSVSADVMKMLDLPSSVKLAYVPIYGIGRIEVTAHLSIGGYVSLNLSSNFSTGFHWTLRDGIRSVKTFSKREFTISAEAKIDAGITATVGLADFKIVEGDLFASVGARMKATAKTRTNGPPNLCIHTQAWLYAETGFHVSFLGFGYDKTYPIWKANNSPVRMVRHYEDGSWVKKCTYGDKEFGNYFTASDSGYWSGNLHGSSTGYDSEWKPYTIYEYSLDESDRAIITKYYGNVSSILIPQTLDGHDVIAIGSSAFAKNTLLRNVTIPEGITTINSYAFQNCTNLMDITFPDSLTDIGISAFSNCSNLTELTFPKKLKSIGRQSFEYCTSLQKVFIPSSLDIFSDFSDIVPTQSHNRGPFYECPALNSVTFEEGITTISNHLFAGCTGLQNITIPDSVTTIGSHAFNNCTNLSDITFSKSLTKIGIFAFSKCSKLTELSFPKNLQSIDRQSFGHCTSLQKVFIPSSLNINGDFDDIGHQYSHEYGPFYECSALNSVTFENGITTISNHLFAGCTGIENITIPDSVTTIGSHAFNSCTKLTNIIFSNSLTSINKSAFANCSKLNDVTFPQSLTNIGTSAFANCTKLTELTFPKSLRNIGGSSFQNCTILQKIFIPSSLNIIDVDYKYGPFYGCSTLDSVTFEEGITTISNHLFAGCTGLKNITIPDSVTTIENNAFYDCSNLSQVELSKNLISIGIGAFAYCPKLSKIQMPDKLSSIGNIAFLGCTILPTINLPEMLTSIGESAFSGCASLESIIIPDSVTSMGREVFNDCTSLTSAKWNKKLTMIPSRSFYNCKSLRKFTIPETVTGISNMAFYDCASLENLTLSSNLKTISDDAFYNNDALKKLVIPDSVTSIGTHCFADCNSLKDLTFGSGLTEIPSNAFYQCPGLEKINLPYRLKTIGSNAFVNCTGLTGVTIPRSVTAIDSTAFSYSDRMTIYGVAGTTAETFAKAQGFKFEAIDITATKVTLNKTEATLSKGQTLQLTPTITPADFTDATAWKTSDASIATVTDAGLVKGVGVGTATINFVVGNVKASCTVTVTQPVTSIYLNKTSLSLDGGATYQLTATAYPSNAQNREVSWSSSAPEIASVSDTGMVTAKKKGTAEITVKAKDGSGVTNKCTVTVLGNLHIVTTPTDMQSSHPYEVNSNDKWQYTKTGAAKLAVTFNDQTSVEQGTDYIYIYSKDGTQVGKYTGTELAGKTIEVPGDTVIIKLTSDDTYCEYGFAVTKIEEAEEAIKVTGVTLDKTTVSLEEGNTTTLTATVAPANATNKTVTWKSSNTSVVTVDNGKITAVKAGTATITVTTEDGNKTATCNVTVTPVVINVTGVTLDKTTVSLEEGNTTTLTATVAPANATNKAVTWSSSNTSVATVDNGKITAIKAGTATITVTTEDGNKTATCNVTVTEKAPTIINVTGVTLDQTTVSLEEGSNTTLTATVAPANATNKAVTWKSSDDSVATVDNGKVTAVKAGIATITVTTADGNKTATCKVTVTEKAPTIINVTGVTLDQTTVSLEEGSNTTLTATVAPANATNKAVTWKSSNTSVATVDNGKVAAVKAGTATITVTTEDGSKTATCEVTVTAKAPTIISVTGVTLNKAAVSLEEGNTTTLTATVAPANATNKAVTWSSSNTSVATVDNGKVTAVKAGTATITVTTADGGKSAVCEIKVTAKAPEVNFSDVAADAWYVSYVYDLAGKGIINGITPTTFDPEGKITRGQFVKILAYASGDDLSAYSGDSVFADANAHWSKANINWAYTNKIVYGKSDTQFAPDANITRQEMAVMIKRYADYKAITLPKTNAPITFTDEAEIAAWAKEAVSAMQQANIISGFPDGTFAPQGNATRAQAAKMISVFLSL